MARKPRGPLVSADFRLESVPLPELSAGQVLVQTLTLSVDANQRLQLAGRHPLISIRPGDLVRGRAICRVVRSTVRRVRCGEIVIADTGWSDHAIVDAEQIRPVLTNGHPPTLALGVLGHQGLAAYVGVTRIAKVRKRDHIVVSAAASPVGSTIAQLAQLRGARVIGIAGGAEKCRWLRDIAGLDQVIDHQAADWQHSLRNACAGGASIYFDLVGGDMLHRAMDCMQPGGRIILCGAVSDYDRQRERPGPSPLSLINARVSLQGFVACDFSNVHARMVRAIGDAISAGRLAYHEEVTAGLENAPDVLMRLMRGATFGKALVQVAT